MKTNKIIRLLLIVSFSVLFILNLYLPQLIFDIHEAQEIGNPMFMAVLYQISYIRYYIMLVCIVVVLLQLRKLLSN